MTTAHRPRLAALQSPVSPSGNGPASPHTPRGSYFSRSISSAFNSPGNTFRTDDDIFVFEFGSRYMRAGLGGESNPRSVKDFGPLQQKRAGDYSQWLPHVQAPGPRQPRNFQDWGADHELWSLDVRYDDLGLVSDKVERAVRMALQDDLLIVDDSKRRLYSVAIPPRMPRPLLSTLMTTLFNHYPSPGSITLLSIPTVCTVAAGLRSALVIDIGWEETTVTAVYEYREVQHRCTSRAMKLLSWETRNMLLEAVTKANPAYRSPNVSFEDVEEVMTRMVWCNSKNTTGQVESKAIQVPLETSDPNLTVPIPFSDFAAPVETALFAIEQDGHYDNEELPIPNLTYLALLSLPLDIRRVCLPRIIITGGGSNIPGIKARIISEVSDLIAKRGWDPVHHYGKATRKGPEREQAGAATQSTLVNKDVDPETTTPAHLQPPLADTVLARIQSRTKRNSTKSTDPSQSQNVLGIDLSTTEPRSVFSLGAWAGASLIAGLRVRGLVEVEREKYLQHGLAGADDSKRQSGPPPLPQRRSIIAGAGASFNKTVDRASGSWTLGIWG